MIAASSLWNQPGVPHRGWTCLGAEDLGEPLHLCEMCRSQHCRYVHAMEHPEYPGTLHVGCICAGKMEDEYAARERERVLRRATRRKRDRARARARARQRWIETDWRTSPSGNETKLIDHIMVLVARSGETWRIAAKRGDDWVNPPGRYATELEAKGALWDSLLDGEGAS
jgi:hypothetical protein